MKTKFAWDNHEHLASLFRGILGLSVSNDIAITTPISVPFTCSKLPRLRLAEPAFSNRFMGI